MNVGKIMKRLALAGIAAALGLGLVGCVGSRQFDVSLKEGLFQGTAEGNPALTVSLEFSEMDRGEFVKTHKNTVKDLSTIDTKFYTAYRVWLIFSEGNENYVAEFGGLVAKNAVTTDTYRMKDPNGDAYSRSFELADVELKLVDSDGDKIADEVKLGYTLNGTTDGATLRFRSEGTSDGPLSGFEYHCYLTVDEALPFEHEADELFYPGERLRYLIDAREGYKVEMYVNGEKYAEAEPNAISLMDFSYVTGYSDVSVEFRAVPM